MKMPVLFYFSLVLIMAHGSLCLAAQEGATHKQPTEVSQAHQLGVHTEVAVSAGTPVSLKPAIASHGTGIQNNRLLRWMAFPLLVAMAAGFASYEKKNQKNEVEPIAPSETESAPAIIQEPVAEPLQLPKENPVQEETVAQIIAETQPTEAPKDVVLVVQAAPEKDEQWNWKHMAIAIPVGGAAAVAARVLSGKN